MWHHQGILTMAIASITVQEVAALRQQGQAADLLDVRTPAEYQAVHAEGARLVPLQTLTYDAAIAERPAPAEPLYVICKSGGRSLQACTKLAAGGLNAVNVAGGTDAWVAAGLPVVRGAGASGRSGG
jgi:rhodanese-related sulfurtransferase